jgi:type II secretory pathway predicted ATPase ExeA
VNKKLLALFGLKWNPFSPDVPTEALLVAPRIESFCWRVENLAREGGFALVTGAPGIGKSVALRLLVERLGALREIKIGVMVRPHSGVSDFYRKRCTNPTWRHASSLRTLVGCESTTPRRSARR